MKQHRESGIYLILIVLFIFFIVSCKQKQTETHKYLIEFIGCNISLPNDIYILNLPANIHTHDFLNAKCKLIIFIDSSECTTCSIKNIHSLDDYIMKINDNFSMFCIFNSSDINLIKSQINFYCLKVPYFVDINGVFKKQNNIPKEKKLHTFLVLDNKVILAGNPANNKRLKKLYEKIIKKYR